MQSLKLNGLNLQVFPKDGASEGAGGSATGQEDRQSN
jgi:hypothetical protein